MRVTAVVVNFNGARDLPACVASLRAQTLEPAAIVVVDNASVDSSRVVLAELSSIDHPVPVVVVANTWNRGFAGGANDGLERVGDVEAVLVANPDVVLDRDYLAHAVAALDADRGRGAVQGRLHRTVPSPSGDPVLDTTGHVAFRTRLFRNRGEGQVDRGQWNVAGEVFGVSGAVALYRRAMLDDVAVEVVGRGGRARREVFDEDLFAFFEDVDLDWRAALRGWACWYEPRAVATHERGGAGPRRTPRVEQLNFRNRLLVLVKDDTWRALLPSLPGLVLTTVLKTVELALSNPSATAAVLRSWRLVAVMRRKRAAVHRRAVVSSEQVVARWFAPFDYTDWVATWWRRVRGHPVAHHPSPGRTPGDADPGH